MENEEKLYRLGFSLINGIGPKTFKLLIDFFGSATEAWKSSSATLTENFGQNIATKVETYIL